MSPEPQELAERIGGETGLDFVGAEGRDGEGNRWLEVCPAGHPVAQTFVLRTTIGWRRLEVRFQPGSFASDLLSAMGNADETGRRAFTSVLAVCEDDGAEIELSVNGSAQRYAETSIWSAPWRTMELVIRKGMLAINEGDAGQDMRVIALWASRAAAAITSILPLETDAMESAEALPDTVGLPEGAKTRIEVNRYERDRRNRAAALAIHGYGCKACDLNLSDRYGVAASGLIEVHHVTPVSEVGAGYIIDPRTDLLPLCPNCHSVAHRRTPPYSAEEIRQMLATGESAGEVREPQAGAARP